MVNNDSDEQLGALLDSALATHLGSDRIDVAALAAGSRRRARRIRSRRNALIGAGAALLVAIPVGYQVISPEPHGPAGSTGSDSAALLPSGAAEGLPNSMALPAAELPKGLVLRSQRPLPAGSAAADGVTCPAQGPTTGPRSGRQWRWGTQTGAAEALSVTVTLTRWRGRTEGAEAFGALTHGSGQDGCRWDDPQVLRHGVTIAGAQESWAETSGRGTPARARTLIRVGELIAAVDVHSPAGVEASAALADRLATAEAKRLS